MPIPEFIVELRRKIGHDLLWLPSVTAAVFNDSDEVLLVRRADNHWWTLVTGCLEPGEQPAEGALREVMEEAAVEAKVERLLRVQSTPEPGICASGDVVQWMDVAFRCSAIGGEARVNDDESIDVGWFDPYALPAELPARQAEVLADALAGDDDVQFVVPE